jgi:hypothetical protein
VCDILHHSAQSRICGQIQLVKSCSRAISNRRCGVSLARKLYSFELAIVTQTDRCRCSIRARFEVAGIKSPGRCARSLRLSRLRRRVDIHEDALPTLSAALDQVRLADRIVEQRDREGTPMRPRLRLFTGEDEEGSSDVEAQVNVRFGEITRALVEAVRWDRTWLRDFEDDEVRVSSDLYEVIASFTRLRPSA